MFYALLTLIHHLISDFNVKSISQLHLSFTYLVKDKPC